MQIVKNIENFTLSCGAFIEKYNPTALTRDDTPEVRENILNLHIRRHEIFHEFRLTPVENEEKLAILADRLAECEYDLQEAWGFEQDNRYHSYWYQVPHCTCSIRKNRGVFNIRLIEPDCPVHKNHFSAHRGEYGTISK